MGSWDKKVKLIVILLPFSTAAVGHYLTDALLFFWLAFLDLSLSRDWNLFYLPAWVIILLQKHLLLRAVCVWLELEVSVVPMLCSSKSLWGFSAKGFLCLCLTFLRQGTYSCPSFSVEQHNCTQVRPGLNITWWILKPKSWCLNQNSPGKTLLWTQQQHYTCASLYQKD